MSNKISRASSIKSNQAQLGLPANQELVSEQQTHLVCDLRCQSKKNLSGYYAPATRWRNDFFVQVVR